MALSNRITNLNLHLVNSIDQFNMPTYNRLSHAFSGLHKDMISLCLQNKALKSKASSLTKEIQILKSKDEQHRLNEDILRIENEKLQAQINYLNVIISKFTNGSKEIIELVAR